MTPGYPLTPLAFLVLAALMLVLVAVHSPGGALLGVVVVSAGLPVYEVFRRKLTTVTDHGHRRLTESFDREEIS